MKKIFTLIFSTVVINYSANAQALPNPGFENWTDGGSYDNPNNWSTLNSLTSIFQFYTCTKSTDAHSGTNSVRLETKYSGPGLNTNINGIITTGEFQVSGTTGASIGGAPYTLRPDSIIGWYKYTPSGNDTGYAEVILLNATDDDTLGRGVFSQTSTVADWTRFAAAINYDSTISANPALLRINLNSSSGNSPQAGSVIFFDDLEFAFTTGIKEENRKINFSVYPNPATDELYVKNSSNEAAKMHLFDVAGKKITELSISLNTTRTNISSYSQGVYLYTISDKNSEILHTGKFVITR